MKYKYLRSIQASGIALNKFSNKFVRKSFSLALLFLLLGMCLIQAQLPTEFQRVDLLTNLTNSTTMEFSPDGRIFLVDRYGELLIYKTDTQTTVVSATVPVFHEFEDGLLGIAFDPNFIVNNYVYLQYSPISPSVNRVSRFTLNGDILDLSSELVVLDWPTQREICCHSAGDMKFDSQGNLYIATGDNTQHSDYATLNEFDSNLSSENTSSNTNDLRGKILRITPESDGSYTIPGGNLFPGGTGGLPEIYVMGARNPFRIFVDKENTDWLFWGEVGPDANHDGAEGPNGMDEINLTKSSGNYGWPYFSGENEAYLNTYSDPQFYYDPAAPVNLSVHNTGATNLPVAQESWLDFYHKCYLAGPRYYYDSLLTDQQRLPIEFDEGFFYYDFNTSQIWLVHMDANGVITSNKKVAPLVFPSDTSGFIDLELGPDGHLYILEYGVGCCPDNSGTGKLVRVDYTGIISNSTPNVSATASPTSGSLPLDVNFDSTGTTDPDGDTLSYAWDFESDGIVDSTLENPMFTYTVAGTYTAQLKVSDGNGGVGTKNLTIVAGNTAATFTFTSPLDGGFVGWGDDINFSVTVDDVEDGSTLNSSIDCADVNMVPSLGHLNHFHDDITYDGCPRTITLGYEGHDIYGEMDIYYVLGTNYTDQGGLISFDQIQLHPKRKEAEFYDVESNITVLANNDPWVGGSEVIRVNHNSYIVFEGRNLSNITSVKYRVASGTLGGEIELRVGSPIGALLATTPVPVTGSFSTWIDVESSITDPGGKNDLYFVFKKSGGGSDLFDVNYIEFLGTGVSVDNSPADINAVTSTETTKVQVEFSEEVTQSTAESLSNYAIDNGISISSSFLEPDNRTVTLTTTVLTPGISYNLSISNVENLSGISVVASNHSFLLSDTIRINSGGPEVVVSGGSVIYDANQYGLGGTNYENVIAIAGTLDDEIYTTEVYGANLTYEIPISVSGYYDVRLHFAELYHGVENSNGVGSRVFNVSIEGTPVLTNFDILAEVAPATALAEEFNDVSVTDGFLSIEIIAVTGDAKISAIEVLPLNTFSEDPSVTIVSPLEGATVGQPFNVSFEIENWEVGTGNTHMHYYIDDVMIGPHYNLDPIEIDGLSLDEEHTIKIELFQANHTGTGVFDEVTVTVADQPVCVSLPFPDQWEVHEIDDTALPYRSVYILPQEDMDGDGLKDIVTGGWWYKNPGTASGNWIQHTIGAPFNNVAFIHDFDNDGDQDLFGTQGDYEGLDLAWAQNDGSGNFTVHTNIPSGTTTFGEPFLAGISGAIFQSGGPYQMAINWNGAEHANTPVQMLTVPSDPVNGTWVLEDIHPTSLGEGLSAGDIDGDGDLDLFQAANWLRNDGATWTLFSTGLTLTSTLDRNVLSDLDRDGDLDGVVGQLLSNREVAWFEAPSDPTQSWIKNTIYSNIDGGLSIGVADMDFDGDDDVIVGEWKSGHKLYGFENDLCNTGTWITHEIDAGGSTFDHHDGAQIVDIDNDGDLDIISIGWDNVTPRIFENTGGIPDIAPVANAGEDQTVLLPTNSIILTGSGNDPDGGSIVSYQWSQESGPNTATLTNEDTTDVTSSALIEGDYVFRLTVTDDEGDTGYNEVTVTVSVGVPVADAGEDQTVILSTGSLVITGSGTDPDGGAIVSYLWTQESGPSTATLTNEDTAAVTASNLVEGSYVFRLTVTDNEGDTGFDDVTVLVTTQLAAIRINSGGPSYSFNGEDWMLDQYYDVGDIYDNVVAIANTDNDGLYQTERYADTGSLIYEIPVSDGNYDVNLHFAELYYTTVGSRIFNIDIEGGQSQLNNYDIIAVAGSDLTAVVENITGITVNDGYLTITLTSVTGEAKISGIEIIGYGSGGIQPPVVDVGSDQSLVLPSNSVVLTGLASDPDGGAIVSYLWTQESGPSTATLTNEDTAAVTASNLVEGSYVFRLTVTDNEGDTSYDDVSINIVSQPSVIRINSGGPSYSFNGEDWMLDQYYDVGDIYDNVVAIANTDNDGLYQTERYADTGSLIYEIPVSDGNYDVNLHFAELYYTTVGSRIFNIDIEGGQSQLNNYDIIAVAGSDLTAVVENITGITVIDGYITITLTSITGDAKISGIEIAKVSNIPVTGVLVSPSTGSIALGTTIGLTATVSPANAGDTSVTWSSSDDAIATVDATGLVTGLAEGQVSITATTTDGGFTSSAVIDVVPVAVTGVLVSPSTGTIELGTTIGITVTVSPSNAGDASVTWSSSDDAIATVDATGLVTGLTEGQVTITATTTDGGFTSSAVIDVVPVAVTGVLVSPSTRTIELGTTIGITATVSPANAGDTSVTWSSSDDAIATVDATGLVTGLTEGQVTITATTTDGGFTSSAVIDVVPVAVTGVLVSPSTGTIELGTTIGITVTVSPSNAGDASVTWSSSDDAIATVDATGLVTGLTEGQVTITATTTDGGFTSSAVIDVVPVAVTGVLVSPSTGTIELGTTIGITVTVSPSNAGDASVTWSSSDDAIATVDATGLVTGLTEGQVTITATTTDGGFTSSAVIDVVPVAVTGVLVSPSTRTIELGTTIGITATVSPANAGDTSVTWSSSDDAIATVDATGLVTGLTEGQVTITATTTDGGFTSSAVIDVVPVAVTGVLVSPSTGTIELGTTIGITVTVSPSNAGDASVTWSSSDDAIATVDATGLVTGLTEGQVTITATTTDGGFTSSAVIDVVPVAVTGVLVSPSTGTIELGTTIGITVTVSPSNAGDASVTWSSSDDAIATVDATGLVTGLTEGQVTITATTTDGGFTSSAVIDVVPVAVTGVLVSPSTRTIELGTTIGITATVSPSNAGDASVTWSSSDDTIATVDATGLVTGLTEGQVSITATTTDGGFTSSAVIDVVPVAVTGILVSPSTGTIELGTTIGLTATVSPANAGDTSVTWSSSNDAIATVDATGLVTGLTEGQVTITATTTDGGFTSSAVIDVVAQNEAPIAIITANPLMGEVPLPVIFSGINSTDDKGVANYFWNFDDGFTSSQMEVNHVFEEPGIYNVELTVEDEEGLMSTATVVVTVEAPNAAPVANISASPLNGDAPLEVSFMGSNSTDDNQIVEYLWNFNDGNTSTEINPVHIFTGVGVFDITLTVTDSEGLTDEAVIQIAVNEPVNNEAPIVIASATPLSGFTPLEVSFMSSDSTDDMGIVSYSWDFMDGGTSTEANPVHVFTEAGIYLVSITVEDNEGLTDQTTIEIIVNEVNEAPIAVATATPLTGNAPLEVSFVGSDSTDDNGIVSYFWDFGNGDSSSQMNPLYTFEFGGSFNVMLTVTDEEGLIDTFDLVIEVDDNISFEIIDGSAVISPNPAYRNVYLYVNELTSGNNVERIYLFDSIGKLITSYNPMYVMQNRGIYRLPVETLRNEMYHVKVVFADKSEINLGLLVKNFN